MRRIATIQTPWSYLDNGVENILPSRTIPGLSVEMSDVFMYLENNEPLPPRFFSRAHDVDGDGIMDAEVRMLDILEESFNLSQAQLRARDKLRDSEVYQAWQRDKEKQAPKSEDIKDETK